MVFPVFLLALLADVRGCVCNPVQPVTMEPRECSLTAMAVLQKQGPDVFIVHDASPLKPHRWLAVPRNLRHTLNDMTSDERTVFWTAAIAKANEVWNRDDNAWGIAVNGIEKRSQCQMHAHIGKLKSDADLSGGMLVSGPAQIPAPADGAGIWIHLQGGKLCVHPGRPAGELMLER